MEEMTRPGTGNCGFRPHLSFFNHTCGAVRNGTAADARPRTLSCLRRTPA